MLAWNAEITTALQERATELCHERDRRVRPPGQDPAARPMLLARTSSLVAVLILLLSPATARADDCLHIRETAQHIGETKCVTGKAV